MTNTARTLDELAWQVPEASPAEYARTYCEKLEAIEGIQGVWAIVQGAELHVYTLIRPDRDLERRVYEAELAFFDDVGEAPVAIYVYTDDDGLSSHIKDAAQVFSNC